MLIGYAYITNSNEIHIVDMQTKTVKNLVKQCNEVFLHADEHKMRWKITKKILLNKKKS